MAPHAGMSSHLLFAPITADDPTNMLGREWEAKSPARALRLSLKGAALGDPFSAVRAGYLLEVKNTRKSLLQAQALYRQAVRRAFPDADEDFERAGEAVATELWP